MTGQTDVEASDARGGRAPDPRDDGKEGPRRQTGQHPDRGGLRQMVRAEPRPGGKGRDPRQVRLQAMRRQTGDAVKRWLRRVGKAKRAHYSLRSAGWWARRKRAFAHPTNYDPFTNRANASA